MRLQDLYDIVYFINPDGIRTLLNTPDTHSIINYVYQRYLKVKNWVPTRHYTYYIWCIYGWKEIPHHFPSYDSDHNSKDMVLSRWVPKSVPYEKFISYDHYEVTNPSNNNTNTPITPKIIKSKKQKLLMMPKNHFQQAYTYYDSIRNSKPTSRDLRTIYYNKDKKNKVEMFLKMLEMTHDHLYASKFENEELNLFPTRNIPLDWIVWYDTYNHKFRDALYSYGYRLHTANYFQDPRCKNQKGLIKFCRISNENLVESEPTYLHKVFSKYTRYDHKCGKSVSVPCGNIMVRKNFEKDLYYIGPGVKYTYWNVFPDEEVQSRFSYHISTVGNVSKKFENMYYGCDYEKYDYRYSKQVLPTISQNSDEKNGPRLRRYPGSKF